jgi:hypothetical protein
MDRRIGRRSTARNGEPESLANALLETPADIERAPRLDLADHRQDFGCGISVIGFPPRSRNASREPSQHASGVRRIPPIQIDMAKSGGIQRDEVERDRMSEIFEFAEKKTLPDVAG